MKRVIIIVWFLFSLLTLSTILTAQDEASKQEWLKNGVFAQRRAALIEKMDGGIAIFKGAEIITRNSDIDYLFRQESNFHYLTGFDHPGAVFLLIPGAEEKFIMFVKEKNLQQQMWSGKTEGTAACKSVYGADAAFPIATLDEKLPGVLRGIKKIYCSFDDEKTMQQIIALSKRSAAHQSRQIQDPRPLIGELRLFKSKDEIAMIQKAVDITTLTHREMMTVMKPGLKEYQVAAMVHHLFQDNGSPRVAFQSIIGTGPGASVMHYTPGSRQTADGGSILIDIGAEYGYYSADVTRTIPVNGKFSPRQKEIYNIVLNAQYAGISVVKPGKGFKEVFKASLNIMISEMVRLGLLTNPEKRWQQAIWFRYFQLGHWLGLDTHDVGDMHREKEEGRILEPGIVFAFEPGIYIDPSLLDKMLTMELPPDMSKAEVEAFVIAVRPIAEKYADICIRIEDNILVTETGCTVLSQALPKDIKGIEKLMKQKSKIYH